MRLTRTYADGFGTGVGAELKFSVKMYIRFPLRRTNVKFLQSTSGFLGRRRFGVFESGEGVKPRSRTEVGAGLGGRPGPLGATAHVGPPILYQGTANDIP